MATRKKTTEPEAEIETKELEVEKSPALDPIAAATAAVAAMQSGGGSGELEVYSAGKLVDSGKKIFLQSDLDNLQAQIDALNAQLNAITKGSGLSSGADLNDVTTPGHYIVDTSAKAQTIIHRPTGVTNPFGIDVKFNTAANRITQTVYVNTNDLSIYQRKLLSGGWTKWAKYTGTETEPVEPVTP